MKFTFKSEQFGTVVEMNFEGMTLSEIEEMYKQFLRGSGFYIVEDEDDMYTKQQNSDTSEECVHESDKSIHEEIERLKAEIKRANELAEYRLKLLMQIPENKPWVSLTDEEIVETVGSQLDEVYLFDFRRVIAKLKEKNT